MAQSSTMLQIDKFCILVLISFVTQFAHAFDFGKIIGDIGRSLGIHSPDESLHKSIDVPSVYIDGKWIKSPSLNNNQIYLFAENVDTMTWYEADDYCGKHGAILAEPFSTEESNFLRDHANTLPDTNWWIGLRQFEKCKCTTLGRSQKPIFAFTEPDSLHRQVSNGLGRTSCPGEYQKLCSGHEWRWRFSGQRLLYSYWNTRTNEPNDIENEHCVTMWFKSDNQRWGNWRCDAKKDGDKHKIVAFKPVCQKSEDDDQYLFE